MKVEYYVAYSSIASVLVPLSLALLQRRSLPDDLKPLFWILIISLSCDVLAFFLVRRSINTHWIGNTYLIAQFSLAYQMFRKHIGEKAIIDTILILFLLFYFVNITLFEGPWVFNSVSNVVACLVLMGFSLFYFYRLLNDLPIIHIQHLPMFWVSVSVLAYYAGNFFLFLVKNYLVYGESGSHRLMWILHNLLNITKNLLFAIALWQSYRKARSSTLSSSAR